MSNVVSILSRRIQPPSKELLGWLLYSTVAEGYLTEGKFSKEWDDEAGLWRMRLPVSHPATGRQDMLFWYNGDSIQWATEVGAGETVSHKAADQVAGYGRV